MQWACASAAAEWRALCGNWALPGPGAARLRAVLLLLGPSVAAAHDNLQGGGVLYGRQGTSCQAASGHPDGHSLLLLRCAGWW